jgi:cytochrome b
MSVRAVAVWDLPTRLFHWLLVAAVVVSYATGGEDGVWFAVHTSSGYVIAMLLLFRVVWGFVGSVRSRFSDFVLGRRRVIEYAKRLTTLAPPRYVGHNPLGGWMIVLMLLVLASSVVTGLFSSQEGNAHGLLFPLIAGYDRHGLGEIHELLGNVVVLLACVHIAGVFVDWFLTGDNLVRAMINGKKTVDDAVAAEERPLAPVWRAGIIALLVVVAGFALFQKTDFASISATHAAAAADDGAEEGADHDH